MATTGGLRHDSSGVGCGILGGAAAKMKREKKLTPSHGGTEEQRKRVCIISLADIGRMAPVLRQIEYLSPHFDVTVIGHGEAQPGWDNVRLLTVPKFTMSAKRLSGAILMMGRILPRLYETWYWR